MSPAPGRRIPPPGLLLFLGYAFLVLGGIGISLRWVVDQAIGTPVSLPGIVAMILLAYTIFTITMVFQRKQAARGLAVGLSTLTVPAVPLLLLGPVPATAVVPALLGVALFLGLRRPSVVAWLSEP
jgi:succinate-acetate transporter protein